MKEPFIKPKKRYYIGRIRYGCPYFYPWNFNQTILTIRKKKPEYLRCKYFKLFGYYISYGWPVLVRKYRLGWKDKFESPRFEWAPSFQIYFFFWQFCIWWVAPDGDNDLYYEMWLWYDKYCDKDIVKAKDTWGWVDYDTKESTWDDKYINYKNTHIS